MPMQIFINKTTAVKTKCKVAMVHSINGSNKRLWHTTAMFVTKGRSFIFLSALQLPVADMHESSASSVSKIWILFKSLFLSYENKPKSLHFSMTLSLQKGELVRLLQWAHNQSSTLGTRQHMANSRNWI